ncbi:MAG: sigma-70 family RNA polymerase sigma factor [Bacteroidales bacterium]|nr:sigma-70 family RNA polymerase sigma factor [Candidatus Physcousia equi]
MKSYSTLTDDQLVCLYQEGNDSAFDALLSRHQTTLFNYIFFLVKDEDLANDVFQDTFVRAITAIRQGSYQPNGNFRAWLMQISRNLSLDHHRHTNCLTIVSQEFVGEGGDVKRDYFNNANFSGPTMQEDLEALESAEIVRDLVDCLNENQREAVYLRYYENLSFKQMAEVLGVSINTALGRIHYAIRNLRTMAQSRRASLVG